MPGKSFGILLSGSYVEPSLIAEHGRLPPSFLALANKRLYTWQIETFPKEVGKVVMTIPSDFVPDRHDADWLKKRHVALLPLPSAYSLGEAIYHALKQKPDTTEDVWLLFGDTLLPDFSALPLHALAVGHTQEHSSWGYFIPQEAEKTSFKEAFDSNGTSANPVVSGGFHLNAQTMSDCLEEADNKFYDALNLYYKKTNGAVSTCDMEWYDFGHTHSYFRSRQRFTTQRVFNELKIETRHVCKYSEQTVKILAEASWFESVPRYLDVFLPNYLGRVREQSLAGYATEYLYLNPINDLFVYGRLPQYVWKQILSGCKEFLDACAKYEIKEEISSDVHWLYKDKTHLRLQKFSAKRGFSLDRPWLYNGKTLPSINEIFETTLRAIPELERNDIRIIHGDFHFANIFFDFRSLGIKAVDPRGLIKDIPTIYGDARYDLAKLSHSITGLYDFIVADILKADVTDQHSISFDAAIPEQAKKIQTLFMQMNFGLFSPQTKEIKAIVILLFLSMLPLHGEKKSRQDTMLANVFRLYEDFLATAA